MQKHPAELVGNVVGVLLVFMVAALIGSLPILLAYFVVTHFFGHTAGIGAAVGVWLFRMVIVGSREVK